jgi:hypothetical protein
LERVDELQVLRLVYHNEVNATLAASFSRTVMVLGNTGLGEMVAGVWGG